MKTQRPIVQSFYRLRTALGFAVAAGMAGLLAPAAHAALTTTDLLYNWDGDGQTETTWTSTGPASGAADSLTRAWSFPDDATVSAGSSGSTATSIASAYTFTGGSYGTTSAFNDDLGTTTDDPPTNASDASFEVWYRPADLTGNEVIFESGGTQRGLALVQRGDTVYFLIDNTSNTGGTLAVQLASAALTTEDLADFIQVVGVIDPANGQSRLYVNSAVDSATNSPTIGSAEGFAGGNPAGLGGSDQVGAAPTSSGSPTYGTLDGQIGIVRIYDAALTDQQVADNYNAVVPEPASVVLLGAGVVLALRRRREA